MNSGFFKIFYAAGAQAGVRASLCSWFMHELVTVGCYAIAAVAVSAGSAGPEMISRFNASIWG